MSFESYILDVIEDRKKASGFFFLLSAVSRIYQCGVFIRNALYDRQIFKSHHVESCVVSVGNVVVGGTGKTPVIHFLSHALTPDLPTSIISRGYRSLIEKSGVCQQISQGDGPTVRVDQCGDEPFWLASHTQSSVWVGKDKLASAQSACRSGAKVLFIDDGMQHRRLHRDIEIVLLDGRDPWGKNAFLPKGLLRDSPKRLACADLVVVSNVNTLEEWQDIQKQVQRFTASPIVLMHRSYSMPEGSAFDTVGIFCGIAKPEAFASAIVSLDMTIVDRLYMEDHILPQKEVLQAFASSCKEKGAQVLICTEKDWVKILGGLTLDLPVRALQMTLEIREGREAWDACMKKIVSKGKAFL
ncbi:MAG: tetraacyldisaccharide 4'-kinase [Chlamydiae bacterium]|nr:tetraacyldisaccharide 4'-kinase [Chlamydiota bacterium]